MSFVAEASRVINATSEVAFDRLADHASWSEWMPRSFRPVGPSLGTLTVGARPLVRIAGLPGAQPIKVTVVVRAKEIAWRGGSAVLGAEHRFLFDPFPGDATRTLVRSVETWRGIVAPIVRPIVERLAKRIGRQQLAALATAVEVR